MASFLLAWHGLYCVHLFTQRVIFIMKYDLTLTPITYFQTPMQHQLPINRQNVQNKPYAKFFKDHLQVPVAMVEALANGALPLEKRFEPTVENLNALLANPYQMPVSGYAVVDGGERGVSAFASSRHFFPRCTTEMWKWWMCWHTVEKERYTLWFPHAHINNSVADPERAQNLALSYEERFFNNPNHIVEYIGGDTLNTIAVFVPPEQFGFDEKLLKEQNISFSASGWAHPVGVDNVANAILIHLARNVEGGVEMFSYYWITPHVEFSRISGIEGAGERAVAGAKQQGLTNDVVEAIAYEMAVHDMTEFTHLGSILPDLYAEFGHSIK